MYFSKRSPEIDKLISALREEMAKANLAEMNVELVGATASGGDEDWLDSLPEMKAPEPSGARVVAAVSLSSEEVRREAIALTRKNPPTELANGEKMRRAGLTRKRFSLVCRNDRYVSFTSDEAIDAKLGTQCGHCRKPQTDHDVEERDSLSELGRELTLKSRWMRELAVLTLMLVGVPRSQIRVPASDRDDPIDLAFSFDNRRYFCELKDDEVTSGDAGNLIARAVEYESPRLMVLTTTPLTDGAARVFEGVRGQKPVILDGPECVTKRLRWEIVFRKLEDFASTVSLSGPGSGLNIEQLLYLHLLAGASEASARDAPPDPADGSS
jgi:hypothetical protein